MHLLDLFKRKHYYIIYKEENGAIAYFCKYYDSVAISAWTFNLHHAKRFKSKTKATKLLKKIKLTTKGTLELAMV